MFDRLTGRQKPKDPEPEKPEFVDLAAIRAAKQPTEPPTPAPGNPLAGYLGRPHRAGLPPIDLAQEFDEQLAKFLEQASTADGLAIRALMEWENHQPGNPGYGAIVAQDHEWVRPFIERGEEVPIAGPLYDWLVRGQHEHLVAAVHTRMEADHADLVLRQYAATPGLRDTLDRAADEIQEQIRVLLVEARDTQSKRAYERAGDLCPQWNRAASLYEWAINPTHPYRRRNPDAWPEALDIEEFQAATEGLGEQRALVPDRLTGMPASVIVTPGSASSNKEIDIHWGPDGPPGQRRAQGVS